MNRRQMTYGLFLTVAITALPALGAERFEDKITLALLGNPDAMTEVGRSYLHGGEIERDVYRGLWYYHQSARAGHLEALKELVRIYQDGNIVPRDMDWAVEFLRLAIENGDDVAAYQLGMLHKEGRGIVQDIAQAYKYLHMSAKMGNVAALTTLANMYLSGDGVEKNEEVAAEMFKLAAENGDIEANKKVAELSPKDEVIIVQDYAAEIAQLKQDAATGNTAAMARLSKLYLAGGEGLDVDVIEGYKWIYAAAQLSNTPRLRQQREKAASEISMEDRLKAAQAAIEWLEEQNFDTREILLRAAADE